MSVRNKKTTSPGYVPGDHWCICDSCGFAIRSSDAREMWTGAIVCKDHWEPRHPQDFVRAVQDDMAAKHPVRPDPEEIFVERNISCPIGSYTTFTRITLDYFEDRVFSTTVTLTECETTEVVLPELVGVFDNPYIELESNSDVWAELYVSGELVYSNRFTKQFVYKFQELEVADSLLVLRPLYIGQEPEVQITLAKEESIECSLQPIVAMDGVASNLIGWEEYDSGNSYNIYHTLSNCEQVSYRINLPSFIKLDGTNAPTWQGWYTDASVIHDSQGNLLEADISTDIQTKLAKIHQHPDTIEYIIITAQAPTKAEEDIEITIQREMF